MSRAPLARVVAVAALLAACAAPSGGGPGAGLPGLPTVVQFSYQAVTPETVRIAAGGNVSWESTASDTTAFVVLPASTASGFRCADLRPFFLPAADVYRSLPLTGGMQTDRVQLPCALKPGSYDYEIWLMGAGFGGEWSGNEPERVLRARIVVE